MTIGTSAPGWGESRVLTAALDQLETAIYDLMERHSGIQSGRQRDVQRAREIYALRRRRDRAFENVFAEPAWDMLLDLFIRGAEGHKTPIRNLCLSSCAPTSTAMRWIDRLLACGFIWKGSDDEDARRALVDLTEKGQDAMSSVLRGA